MSEEELELAIRRILVALDTSPHSLAALEVAADLAVGLKAELLGLFVEDTNLLRLAELPFAWEMGLFSTTRRQLSTREIERQLRAQASRARRALAMTAGRAHVTWSFRVARGAIAPELLTAARETDLVILGKVGSSPMGRRRLGSTAKAVLAAAPGLTPDTPTRCSPEAASNGCLRWLDGGSKSTGCSNPSGAGKEWLSDRPHSG